MERKIIAAVVVAVIFILIVFIYTQECLRKPIPVVSGTNPLVGTAKTWSDLSPDEKIDYLATNYFNNNAGSVPDPNVIAANNYIASLPRDGNCKNDFAGCGQWAANGECDINPEYMLYNCKSSCKSCALSEEEKHNVSAIFNSRSPPGCAFHGAEYPGSLPMNYKVLNY